MSKSVVDYLQDHVYESGMRAGNIDWIDRASRGRALMTQEEIAAMGDHREAAQEAFHQSIELLIRVVREGATNA